MKPKVATVDGLNSVQPEQCHMHSNNFSAIANRKKTMEIKQYNKIIMKDISISVPEKTLLLRITKSRIYKNRLATQENNTTWHILLIVPIIISLALGLPSALPDG